MQQACCGGPAVASASGAKIPTNMSTSRILAVRRCMLVLGGPTAASVYKRIGYRAQPAQEELKLDHGALWSSLRPWRVSLRSLRLGFGFRSTLLNTFNRKGRRENHAKFAEKTKFYLHLDDGGP